MGMGWESYSETMDREDGFIDVLVGQGNSRRGADHDVSGDKRGLPILEIRSETHSKNRPSREISTVESIEWVYLTVVEHLHPAEMRPIGHVGASQYDSIGCESRAEPPRTRTHVEFVIPISEDEVPTRIVTLDRRCASFFNLSRIII